MLFRVTLKQTKLVNGIRLEKGMSVEVPFLNNTLLTDIKGKELIRNAFILKYGIDLKKACSIDSGDLDVKKIN